MRWWGLARQLGLPTVGARHILVRALDDYKKNNDISVFDEKREVEIMKSLKKIAAQHGLDEGFVEEIFLSCFNESKRIQNDIISKSKP